MDTRWKEIPKANGHIHTPWSFSAFEDVEQAFRMAAEENIKVLGINDFNTFEGFAEFEELSRRYKVYPLFNVEFMGLLEQEQKDGIRINDPANPGRIYFCGKGLDFPVHLSGQSAAQFSESFKKCNLQTKAMLEKASAYLQSIDPELSPEYESVLKEFTKGMLRERHIAKAIRTMVFQKYFSDAARINILSRLIGGKELKSSVNDLSGIDNELRGSLLKSGGPAFVKEDSQAFLPLEDIIRIIRDAGGIPCYPVLLDDANGNYNEFEADKEALYQELHSRNICCIELIACRNDLGHLREFITFFHQKGFIITLGSEHNTPDLTPLSVTTRGNIPLDDFLEMVNFEGVCIIAAHQQLRKEGKEGVSCEILRSDEARKEFIELGSKIIWEACN